MKYSALFASLIFSLSAACYAETTNTPDVLEFHNMQSMQPNVISDAQCQDAFKGKILLPANFGNFYSRNLDIVDRKSHHHTVTDDLGLFEWTEIIKIKLSDRELVSPAFVTAIYIDRNHKFDSKENNITNGKTGLLNSYYCSGIVEKIN